MTFNRCDKAQHIPAPYCGHTYRPGVYRVLCEVVDIWVEFPAVIAYIAVVDGKLKRLTLWTE